jgi:hypothetical protein
MKDAPSRKQLMYLFWAAAVVSVGLAYVPFGEFVLYPFSLLSTWVHEMAHGLTAELVGGDFRRLELYASLGGLAYWTRPDTLFSPASALVAAGGLLGPAIAGGAFILLGSRMRTARWVMEALGGVLIVSAFVYVRTAFGFVATLSLGVTALAVGLYANEIVETAVTQFVGIRFCLESLSDVDYMFTKEFTRGGQARSSDSQVIAEQLGMTYWFWGGIIAALSVLILASAFYLAWLRD